MQMYLISDNHDTLTGFRLCGIDGVRANDRETFLPLLEKVTKNSKIGVLLVTGRLYELAKDKINEIKLTRRTPLIVTIPDSFSREKGVDFIKEYVHEAIGVSM